MYKDVREIFASYWKAYGGFRALVRSPYLHIALVLLAPTFKLWLSPLWWDIVIGVLPNLLGFTLGGFAMFLGFGDDKFRALLAEPDDEDPSGPGLYVKLCSTFVHFILVQALALLAALLAKALWFPYEWPAGFLPYLKLFNGVGGGIGFGLFLYACTSIMAATLHVFRIATWYEEHQRAIKQGVEQ